MFFQSALLEQDAYQDQQAKGKPSKNDIKTQKKAALSLLNS